MPANQTYVHFCVLAVLATISPAMASTRQFLQPAPYRVDEGATALASGDLDGDGDIDLDNDGDLDVCVGNVGSTFVSNYYNLNGVFEPSVEVWTTNVVSFVIAADLNADGMQDIIVGNPGNVLYVLINSLSFNTIPQDFNHDGAVTAANLAVLLGVGGTADQAADLNNDGVVDSADLASLLANWSP